MKRLKDLRAYAGTLPYDSELFGIYQPLLGWRSKRLVERAKTTAALSVQALVDNVAAQVQSSYSASFSPDTCELRVDALTTAGAVPAAGTERVVLRAVAQWLPPQDQYNDEAWAVALDPEALHRILVDTVRPQAADMYARLCAAAGNSRDSRAAHADAEAVTRAFLDREVRTAGTLQVLSEQHAFPLLKSMFYGSGVGPDPTSEALQAALDPFAHIDPSSQLDRIRLSPIGIANLFREYFFEFDTFLGPPVGHVWLSPGATVELIETHTRRALEEQTSEQTLESEHKSTTSDTRQDELSTAVKDDNRSDSNDRVGEPELGVG